MAQWAIDLWDEHLFNLTQELQISRVDRAGIDPTRYHREGVAQERAIYRMGRNINKNGKGAAIEQKVLSVSKVPRSPSFDKNLFYWLIVALIDDGAVLLTSSEITKSSQRMLYAWKNGVPPEMYDGFVHQVGVVNIPKRLAADMREPWAVNIFRDDQ